MNLRPPTALVSLGGKSSAEGDAQLAKTQSAAARIKKLTGADASSSTLLMGAPPSYWLDLHQHDTLAIAKGLKQPMLILQGGRDYQVSPEGFELWKTALGARPSVTFKFYPKLNHLFIAGEGKSTPDEYEEPGHVSETVVADIAGWIKKN